MPGRVAGGGSGSSRWRQPHCGLSCRGQRRRGRQRRSRPGGQACPGGPAPHAALCSIPEGSPPASPHHPSGLQVWPEPAGGHLTPDTGRTWALRALDRGEGGARLRDYTSASCTEMDRFRVHGAEHQALLWVAAGLPRPVGTCVKAGKTECGNSVHSRVLLPARSVARRCQHSAYSARVLPCTVLAFLRGLCLCSCAPPWPPGRPAAHPRHVGT